MDWVSVASAGLAAGLAAVIAAAVVGTKGRRGVYVAVVVVGMLLLRAVFARVLEPPVREWMIGRELRALAVTDPLWREIALADPSAVDRLAAELATARRGGRGGDGRALERQVGAAIVGPIMWSKVANAPDDVVLGIYRVSVTALNELASQDEVSCYAFLFPQRRIAARVQATAETKEAMTAAMVSVLQGARVAPQPAPTREQVADQLVIVGRAAATEFGPDGPRLVGLGAAAEGADQGRVCRLRLAILQAALRLPPAQAAPLLRFMAVDSRAGL